MAGLPLDGRWTGVTLNRPGHAITERRLISAGVVLAAAAVVWSL
jgi:hypothetical protein